MTMARNVAYEVCREHEGEAGLGCRVCQVTSEPSGVGVAGHLDWLQVRRLEASSASNRSLSDFADAIESALADARAAGLPDAESRPVANSTAIIVNGVPAYSHRGTASITWPDMLGEIDLKDFWHDKRPRIRVRRRTSTPGVEVAKVEANVHSQKSISVYLNRRPGARRKPETAEVEWFILGSGDDT